MKTITFYSYKGGVGRSLALANIAKRLSEFGKKVCLLDFDLEAPGLHHKFKTKLDSKKGIVDYIYAFTKTNNIPDSILDYCTEIELESSKMKSMSILPAGDVNSKEYWKKLAGINWNDLFYKEESIGIPFFLDLKEKIQREIAPDFLLIDSRTGITEISGVSISLFADHVVVIAASNEENIEGTQQVIKNIRNPKNNLLGKIPEITFVLSRIPFSDKPTFKQKEFVLIDKLMKQINNYISPSNYQLKEMLVIHSDQDLEFQESLKIGYENDHHVVPIAKDYLKLFEAITKSYLSKDEVIKFNNLKEVERLIEKAQNSKNPKEKMDLYNRAIEIDDKNDDTYFLRGSQYFHLESFDDAEKDFNTAISLNSSNSAAYFMNAVILEKRKNYELALKQVNEAIKLRPLAEGHLLKARIYKNLKENKLALKELNEAIENYPGSFSVFNNRADFYREEGQYEKALKDVFKGLEINPTNGTLYATLAEIYRCINKIDEFYQNIELAFIFKAPMEKYIEESEFYNEIKNEERFKKLLDKYLNLTLSDFEYN